MYGEGKDMSSRYALYRLGYPYDTMVNTISG